MIPTRVRYWISIIPSLFVNFHENNEPLWTAWVLENYSLLSSTNTVSILLFPSSSFPHSFLNSLSLCIPFLLSVIYSFLHLLNHFVYHVFSNSFLFVISLFLSLHFYLSFILYFLPWFHLSLPYLSIVYNLWIIWANIFGVLFSLRRLARKELACAGSGWSMMNVAPLLDLMSKWLHSKQQVPCNASALHRTGEAGLRAVSVFSKCN